MYNNVNNSQSTAAVNSASKCIVNALEKSLKKINKVENSDNPMFTGWVKVQEDMRLVVWAGRCYDAETQTYSFSGTFALESKNDRDVYTTDVDCLVGVTSAERMTDDQCIALIIDEFIKTLDSLMTNYNSGPFSGIGRNAYLIKYCYFGGAKNESPCLDEAPSLEDDVVNRVVDVIKENYNNYLPSYLDQFGDCVITVYWNSFSEDDMKMLIENEKVALAVRDVLLSDSIILDKDGFLVYDDGVYLTVDYDKIAKKIDVAPSLEDDITEEGYSVSGLNYLRENMVDADMEDIVDEAYEQVSNDLYVWLNELFRSGECPKDEFMDTMWAYAWDIIRDRGLSDEALEAETRYYVEFDDIVERRLEEWGLYERYNKIHMERAFSNR